MGIWFPTDAWSLRVFQTRAPAGRGARATGDKTAIEAEQNGLSPFQRKLPPPLSPSSPAPPRLPNQREQIVIRLSPAMKSTVPSPWRLVSI